MAIDFTFLVESLHRRYSLIPGTSPKVKRCQAIRLALHGTFLQSGVFVPVGRRQQSRLEAPLRNTYPGRIPKQSLCQLEFGADFLTLNTP